MKIIYSFTYLIFDRLPFLRLYLSIFFNTSIRNNVFKIYILYRRARVIIASNINEINNYIQIFPFDNMIHASHGLNMVRYAADKI